PPHQHLSATQGHPSQQVHTSTAVNAFACKRDAVKQKLALREMLDYIRPFLAMASLKSYRRGMGKRRCYVKKLT
ncbi:MAG: hypothetical protein PUF07_07080, partial [Bacteroidales bacterium]|nr:hypothetical protein [Bacteroidales bacterium]